MTDMTNNDKCVGQSIDIGSLRGEGGGTKKFGVGHLEMPMSRTRNNVAYHRFTQKPALLLKKAPVGSSKRKVRSHLADRPRDMAQFFYGRAGGDDR